jgi:hypothetical protein
MKYSKFIPQNNYVLLKPMAEMINRPIGNSGLVVGVPTHIKDQYVKNYQVRHFEVKKVPDIRHPENKRQFMEMGYQPPYEEEMQLKPKDIVWVNLQAAHQAIKVNFKDREGDFFLVHYSQIYVARRRCFQSEYLKEKDIKLIFDDVVWTIIPLHGFVVCEKIFKKHPYIDKQIDEPGKLKVKWVGKCPEFIYSVKNGQLVKEEYKHLEVKKGDKIQLEGPYIALEGSYFHDLDGKTEYVVTEYRFISIIL